MRFEKITAPYIEKEKTASSEVWNKSIDFTGKNIHITAASGRGKTSLTHFIYGLRKDYTGSIWMMDKETSKMNAEEISTIRKEYLSVVFQDMRLFADYTALENIKVKRDLCAYKEDEIYNMANALGIADKLNQKVKLCSYGEQQRIAIIRALQQPFQFLLLDEPFSHLDDKNAIKAMNLITSEAKKRNASIILLDLQPLPYFSADIIYQL